MNFKRINLQEYLERKPKTYLEERLADGSAEYYVAEEKEFFFYNEGEGCADLWVFQTSEESIFDDKEDMLKIFEFLKNKGVKKVTLSLFKDKYVYRHDLATFYGFKETGVTVQESREFVEYEKYL